MENNAELIHYAIQNGLAELWKSFFISCETNTDILSLRNPTQRSERILFSTTLRYLMIELMIETMKNGKSKKRVLIVDDSEPIRERLRVLLCESPYIQIVGQARNGREARDALKQCRPDTVILDIRLPDSSGIALLKEIKIQFPDTAVIMLTNFDYAQYRQQCRELGADSFLNKTLEFEKIVDTIVGDIQSIEKVTTACIFLIGESMAGYFNPPCNGHRPC